MGTLHPDSAFVARPRARVLLAGVALVSLVAALLTPLVEHSTYLVPRGADLPGARILGSVPLADGLVVSAVTAPTGGVPFDAPLGWRSLAKEADPVSGLRLDSGVASTGAEQVWATTTRGEGALVALVDTGVADVVDVGEAVVAELDFTGGDGGDGYGHGTFMASLIAGASDVAPGVAPAAQILSLKVGDAEGGTDLGTVLTALQWLDGPGREAGVDIAVLALGVDAASPAGRLLDLAVSRVAARGTLVVTAAGNEAEALSAPATAPGSFSAGATDDRGTGDRDDDRMAPFSAAGTDRRGVSQPDVVASGVQVVGWMPCAATLAAEHPNAFVDDGLEACASGAAGATFRGSGTSMSTALAAGVAALAASANQSLGGAELATALLHGAGAGDTSGLHAPALDAPSTVAAAMTLPPGPDPASPPAHAAVPAHAGAPAHAGPPADLAGSGVNWRGVNWRDADWNGVNWRGVNWRGVNWRGADWNGVNWREVNWRGVNWRGADWNGVNWRDVTWRDATWTMTAE